jgi:hypothetical protein
VDGNEYYMEFLIRERLAEARTHAARAALLASARPEPPPLRIALGLGLVRLGVWLLAPYRELVRTRLADLREPRVEARAGLGPRDQPAA